MLLIHSWVNSGITSINHIPQDIYMIIPKTMWQAKRAQSFWALRLLPAQDKREKNALEVLMQHQLLIVTSSNTDIPMLNIQFLLHTVKATCQGEGSTEVLVFLEKIKG